MSKMARLMVHARRLLSLALAFLSPALAAGCCVTPPTAEEILDLGFRSPEQTLRTFQAGVRGDLPTLEFRCFSAAYRRRNGVSMLTYLEFRERELASSPWFQRVVADAKILTSKSLGEARHLLVVDLHGHEVEVELVREDFWQLWSNADPLVDEPIPPGGFSNLAEVAPARPLSSPLFEASVEVTPDVLPAKLAGASPEQLREMITEFRIGREWKIDRIEQPKDRPGL